MTVGEAAIDRYNFIHMGKLSNRLRLLTARVLWRPGPMFVVSVGKTLSGSDKSPIGARRWPDRFQRPDIRAQFHRLVSITAHRLQQRHG